MLCLWSFPKSGHIVYQTVYQTVYQALAIHYIVGAQYEEVHESTVSISAR